MEPPSGAGSAKTPFDLGGIEAGSSREIHCLLKKRLRSSIFTRVFGKDNPWVPRILYFPRMKSRAFKHDVGSASLPPAPAIPARIEHEYERKGAWVYLAAWDVRRAKIFGRCAPRNGIQYFDGLVGEVMDQEPYRSAKRVFWIIDNCSVPRGQKCVQRLQARWPSILPVHTPNHASWINQVEIYFSVVQRKVLTPNDFHSLAQLEKALLAFQQRYEKSAAPFQWIFTREKLAKLMIRLRAKALATAA